MRALFRLSFDIPTHVSRLGKVHLAAPSIRNIVIGVTACANKAETFPEMRSRPSGHLLGTMAKALTRSVSDIGLFLCELEEYRTERGSREPIRRRRVSDYGNQITTATTAMLVLL